MRRHDREVKNPEEIREILDICKVCRLGISDDGRVYIVPMNYGYELEGDKLTLYFHGAREGKKLDLLRKNPLVGIEMDCMHELEEGKTACQYSYYYGSIIGSGKAEIVDEPDQKLNALASVMRHQTGKEFDEFKKKTGLEKAVAIIRVDVGEFTCKCHAKTSTPFPA